MVVMVNGANTSSLRSTITNPSEHIIQENTNIPSERIMHHPVLNKVPQVYRRLFIYGQDDDDFRECRDDDDNDDDNDDDYKKRKEDDDDCNGPTGGTGNITVDSIPFLFLSILDFFYNVFAVNGGTFNIPDNVISIFNSILTR